MPGRAGILSGRGAKWLDGHWVRVLSVNLLMGSISSEGGRPVDTCHFFEIEAYFVFSANSQPFFPQPEKSCRKYWICPLPNEQNLKQRGTATRIFLPPRPWNNRPKVQGSITGPDSGCGSKYLEYTYLGFNFPQKNIQCHHSSARPISTNCGRKKLRPDRRPLRPTGQTGLRRPAPRRGPVC